MLSFRDPLILIFGEKFIQKGWREFDRKFLDTQRSLNAVLKGKIQGYEKNIQEKLKDEKRVKSLIEILLFEREKNQKTGDTLISNDELVD